MNDDQPAVIVKDLYKTFKLPIENHSGLKQVIVNAATRKKGYEVQKVLSDVSFEIKKGEFFGIVGRNGSGKSTLLKLLAGIYTPDKGIVHVNGSLTPFIELGVGFNPELTGRENVFMNGALLGFGKKEMEAMYDDIVEFAELERFMDQKLKNYSSGMQVRLAFSIAIRAKSDVLLIDEVLAVGDAAFQKKCFDYFEKLRQEQQTIILVSHDMASIRRFCTSALLIDKGHIIEIGDVENVSSRYLQLNQPKSTVFKNKASDYSIGEVALKVHSDRATVDIGYSTPKLSGREPIVGITITTQSGIYVVGFNNILEKRLIKKTNSKNVRCEIDISQLLPGDYAISISLYTEDFELLDYKNHASAFSRRGDMKQSKDGAYDIPTEWETK